MSSGNEPIKTNWLKRYKRLLIGLTTFSLIIIMIILIDFRTLLTNISMIGYLGTFTFIIFYTIAFLLRSYKLQLIFRTLKKPIKFSSSYFSLGASFFINDISPGQLGDIVKVFILKDQEEINLGDSFAGIAVERIVDFLMLFCINIFALFFLYLTKIGDLDDRIILGQDLQFYLFLGVVIIIIILVLLLFLLYKQDFMLKIINKISNKLGESLYRLLNNFRKSLYKFKSHKRELFIIILINFLMYIFNSFILVIFFMFLGYTLNIFIVILATLILFFSRIIPITPGGWVLSENIGALFIFIFYPEIAYLNILAVFILDHLLRTAYLLLFGGYSLLHLNFKLKEAKELLK